MIGTVTFDGLSQGQLWKDLAVQLNDGFETLGFSLDTTPKLVATVGLAIGVAIAGGFYSLGIEGARSVGGDFDAEYLRRAFIHSLVPIAMVYVAAHYLTFLLFEGQSIFYLASDPLGEGWNLFGTANSAIDYGLLSQNAAWYLQVGFVVLGHVAALVLAHDRALVIYPDAEARRSARSTGCWRSWSASRASRCGCSPKPALERLHALTADITPSRVTRDDDIAGARRHRLSARGRRRDEPGDRRDDRGDDRDRRDVLPRARPPLRPGQAAEHASASTPSASPACRRGARSRSPCSPARC